MSDDPIPVTQSTRTTLYIQAAVGLSALLAVAIVVLALARPENKDTGPLLLQVFMPVIAALIAAAVQGVHTLVNSNFEEAKRARLAAETALSAQQDLNLVLRRQIDARNSADALAKASVPVPAA